MQSTDVHVMISVDKMFGAETGNIQRNAGESCRREDFK